MQATRRAAAPLRVHQIWDALEKCGSQAPGLEKLMAKVTSLYRIPSGEFVWRNHGVAGAYLFANCYCKL